MDMVGPLQKTDSGNRYFLMVVDYRTRFPFMVPLKTTGSEQVTSALMSIFSMVGIPGEIQTDRGSNFTGKLMQHLNKMLCIRAIRTSPHHPQTDGMVERINSTIKQGICCLPEEFGMNWDKGVDQVLFALRSTIHESTGYSPFELMLGWTPRGLLDLLKESWKNRPPTSPTSALTYLTQIYDKMRSAKHIAMMTEKAAKHEMSTAYNKKAREREFTIGDLVLILLPISSHSLLARWQGPYPVLTKLSETTYLVKLTGKRRPERV